MLGGPRGGAVAPVVVQAVRQGCRVAMRARRDLARGLLGERSSKADASPVTVADFAVQVVVTRTILAAFPDANVCAEEDGETMMRVLTPSQQKDVARRAGERSVQTCRAILNRGGFVGTRGGPAFFVIDPIDGTKGFVRVAGGGQYAVCVGWVDEEGRGVLGCLGCPELAWSPSSNDGVLLLGVRDQGLREYRVPRRWEWEGDEQGHGGEADDDGDDVLVGRPVAPPPPPPPHTPRVVRFVESYESSHRNVAVQERIQHAVQMTGIERLDSQVKYALVALGRAEILSRVTTYDQCIWDILPGTVIALEGGAQVTDAKGRPIDFTRGRTIGSNVVLVSARGCEALHGAMLRETASL